MAADTITVVLLWNYDCILARVRKILGVAKVLSFVIFNKIVHK